MRHEMDMKMFDHKSDILKLAMQVKNKKRDG
jgi:hypothetical protein